MDKKRKIVLAVLLFIAVVALTGTTLLAICAYTLRSSGLAVIEASMTGSSHDVSLILTVSNDDERSTLTDVYVTLDWLPKDAFCRSLKCDGVTSLGNVTYQPVEGQDDRAVFS